MVPTCVRLTCDVSMGAAKKMSVKLAGLAALAQTCDTYALTQKYPYAPIPSNKPIVFNPSTDLSIHNATISAAPLIPD